MKSTIPGYYTAAEAAKVLRRTHSIVCRWVRMGLLPAKRAGKTILIQQGDVHDFTPPPVGNPNFRRNAKSNGHKA
jgi:excisionase family DNA binding protein